MIGVIFLKKPLFIILTLTILCIITSCSNKDLRQTNNEMLNTPATKSEIAKDKQPDDGKSTVSIDPNYDYWKAKPTNSISVYVRKDVTDQRKVYVKSNDTVCDFSWDYNLIYGEPLCQVMKGPDGKEYLYIVLPTQPTEPMINDELYQSKICGQLHILSVDTFKEQTEWQVVPKINKLLSLHPGIKKLYDLALNVSGYQYCYNLKPVENMTSFNFKNSFLVFNGSIGFNSFSDGIYANEQVGIKTSDNLIWLGVIQIKVNTDEPFLEDTSLGNHCGMNFKFYGYSNIRYSPKYKRSDKFVGAFLKNLDTSKRTVDADLLNLVDKDTYINVENLDESYQTYKIAKHVKLIGWDLESLGTVYLTYDEFTRLFQAGYYKEKAFAIKTKGNVIYGIYEIINQ